MVKEATAERGSDFKQMLTDSSAISQAPELISWLKAALIKNRESDIKPRPKADRFLSSLDKNCLLAYPLLTVCVHLDISLSRADTQFTALILHSQ